MLNYVKSEKISLKERPDFNEQWLQRQIAEDPSILGLGNLDLKAREKIQPNAGRLDLLLQDPESDKRCNFTCQVPRDPIIMASIQCLDRSAP